MEISTYDLIVNTDTIKNIGFCDSKANSIDNFIILSQMASVGEYRVDNLVRSNQFLSDLVIAFDECVEDNTGLERSVAIQGQIRLYPNPSSGSINIEFEAAHPEQIIVTDMYGREIRRVNGTMDKKIEVNLSEMASGMYLFHFRTEKGKQYKLIHLLK